MPSVKQIVAAMEANQQLPINHEEEAIDATKETVDVHEAEKANDEQKETTEPVEFEQVAEKASGMSNTITRLLSVSTPTPERPILSKVKSIEKQIDNQKLESRAKRVLVKAAKAQRDSYHIPNPMLNATGEAIDYEKRLRRVGTRGVVVLFNAIRHAQKSVEGEGAVKRIAEEEAGTDKIVKIGRTSFKEMIAVQGEEVRNQPAAGEKVDWIRDDFIELEGQKQSKAWDEDEE